MSAKIKYGLSAAVLALIAAGASAPQILDQFLDEKEGIRCITASVLSDLIIHARYCRRIPALTETAARPGDSSARVCGDNQKRYTPGFTALTERGVVPS